MDVSERKRIGPENKTTARPRRVHRSVSLTSCAGVWPRIPRPRRRRSTRAIIPIENAKAAIWKHSNTGNTHSEVLNILLIEFGDGIDGLKIAWLGFRGLSPLS